MTDHAYDSHFGWVRVGRRERCAVSHSPQTLCVSAPVKFFSSESKRKSGSDFARSARRRILPSHSHSVCENANCSRNGFAFEQSIIRPLCRCLHRKLCKDGGRDSWGCLRVKFKRALPARRVDRPSSTLPRFDATDVGPRRRHALPDRFPTRLLRRLFLFDR